MKKGRASLFYGMRAESIFKGLVPGSKKKGRGADFSYGDVFIEIGRSNHLTERVIVYYRKLFYNIKPKYHSYKDLHPELCMEKITTMGEDGDIWQKPFDKFLFVYFNSKLNRVALFDYKQLLQSPLLQRKNGEWYFNVKVEKLKEVREVPNFVKGRCKEEVCEVVYDFGETER